MMVGLFHKVEMGWGDRAQDGEACFILIPTCVSLSELSPADLSGLYQQERAVCCPVPQFPHL